MESIKVTPETYVRAETDRTFGNLAGLAGGVNRFHHIRTPTPLDKQTVIRMNLDTLYSVVIVDTAKGATITPPGAVSSGPSSKVKYPSPRRLNTRYPKSTGPPSALKKTSAEARPGGEA